MSDENTTEDENKAEANNKVEKKFQTNLKRLIAVVAGKENLHFPKKIPSDNLADLVKDLFEEENEELLKKVKTDLRVLLKQYAEMEKAFKVKLDELEKLKKQKKEEFAKAAEALFNLIDDVGDVEKAYYNGLSEVVSKQVQ